MTGSQQIDAERAFTRMVRSRRRAALARALRGSRCGGHLRVVPDGELSRRAATAGAGVREIPLEAIAGTLEPSRASVVRRGLPARAGRPRGAGSASGSPSSAVRSCRRSPSSR